MRSKERLWNASDARFCFFSDARVYENTPCVISVIFPLLLLLWFIHVGAQLLVTVSLLLFFD